MDDDLAKQFEYNKAKHLSECLAMEKSMQIDFNDINAARPFKKSDIISTSFSDTLLGAPMNHPFQTTELLHISRAPLFTPPECEAIIREAKQHALAAGGWQTARHYSHRTTDTFARPGRAGPGRAGPGRHGGSESPAARCSDGRRYGHAA